MTTQSREIAPASEPGAASVLASPTGWKPISRTPRCGSEVDVSPAGFEAEPRPWRRPLGHLHRPQGRRLPAARIRPRSRALCAVRGSESTRPSSSTGTGRPSVRGCCAAAIGRWPCSTRETWRERVVRPTGESTAPSDYRARTDGRSVRARSAVLAAVDDPATSVVDVRSRDEFDGGRFWPSGGMEDGGRAGHVPGALHLPVDGLVDDDGSSSPPPSCRLCRSTRMARAGSSPTARSAPAPHGLVRADLPARPSPSGCTTVPGPSGA